MPDLAIRVLIESEAEDAAAPVVLVGHGVGEAAADVPLIRAREQAICSCREV